MSPVWVNHLLHLCAIGVIYPGVSLKDSRAAQHLATHLKMSLMWLKNDKYALMLVTNKAILPLYLVHSGESPVYPYQNIRYE